MDYRIIQKEAFKVIGKVFKVSTKDEGHHKAISNSGINVTMMEQSKKFVPWITSKIC